MKIVTFCDYPVYMCFYRALMDIGNEVIIFDLNKVPKVNQYSYISRFLDEVNPEVILTIGRPEVHGLSLESINIIYDEKGIAVGKTKPKTHGLSLEELRELCRKKKILNVYWATEDRTYHEKYSMKIAHNFDFIFTPSKECIKNYNAIGKPSGVLRYGCYPALHRNVKPKKEHLTDIIIAASYHRGLNCNYVKNVINAQENENEENLRKKSVETIVYPLIEKGYNISIWGNGWDNLVPSKYIKGYFPYDDLSAIYSASKIALGLEWDNVSETKTTGRPFEVLGCGTFFITLRTKALSNLFIDKTHLALSDSPQETVELVYYYLNNDLERNKVAEEGQKEVYSRHTYYHRAGEFINALKPFLV